MYLSVEVAQFGRLDEVTPVPLAKGVHVHQIFPLDLVGFPRICDYAVPGCLLELLLGHVGNSVLVF